SQWGYCPTGWNRISDQFSMASGPTSERRRSPGRTTRGTFRWGTDPRGPHFLKGGQYGRPVVGQAFLPARGGMPAGRNACTTTLQRDPSSDPSKCEGFQGDRHAGSAVHGARGVDLDWTGCRLGGGRDRRGGGGSSTGAGSRQRLVDLSA